MTNGIPRYIHQYALYRNLRRMFGEMQDQHKECVKKSNLERFGIEKKDMATKLLAFATNSRLF